ncbi:ABC transporter ATP-binding protein [Mycoplasmatota bacterium]|nr:ABC transporter ATP-binding protein [Mycoplasmatota bacterium]
MPNVLSLKHVCKIYNENTKFPTQVLFDINLDIKEKSFNAIIGQSGSGKSTILNILGLLDDPSCGQVFINDQEVELLTKNEKSHIRNNVLGFIFQFHYLLPEFTALENVLMPYRISGKKVTKEIEQRALELLEDVGLGAYKDNLSTNLSGGQQQRVAIARSLMNHPKIVLADEPTGNLDSDTTDQIYDILRKVNKKYGTTFIVITHNDDIAKKADRIIELKDGKVLNDKTI